MIPGPSLASPFCPHHPHEVTSGVTICPQSPPCDEVFTRSVELLGGPVHCRRMDVGSIRERVAASRVVCSRERRYNLLELGFGEGVQGFGGDVSLRPGREQYGCCGLDVRSLCDEQEVVAAHSKVPGHHLASCGVDRLAGGFDSGWALLDL